MLFVASLHHVFGRWLGQSISPFVSGFYVLAIAAATLIAFRHRGNFARLLRKTELRV